ncbi:permease [Thiocystis minor]|uniref:permease n=1 Tax=Thiocystis minor TaxID=61597 RepID=UPI0030B8FB57
MAASLGIVTPFCSCSAAPLFIGFLSAGVPLGITFSFLIAAPMVNEVALALLLRLFGWKVALLYLGLGLLVAIVAGLIIGELRMDRQRQRARSISSLGTRGPWDWRSGSMRLSPAWMTRVPSDPPDTEAPRGQQDEAARPRQHLKNKTSYVFRLFI